MSSTASLDTIFINFTDSGRFKDTVGLYKEFLAVASEDGSHASFKIGKSQDIKLRLVLLAADELVVLNGEVRNGQTLPYWAFGDMKEATDIKNKVEKDHGYKDTKTQQADQYLMADGAGDFFFFGGHPNPSFPKRGAKG